MEIGFVQNVDQSNVLEDFPLDRDHPWKVMKKWKRAWRVKMMKLMMMMMMMERVRVRRKNMRWNKMKRTLKKRKNSAHQNEDDPKLDCQLKQEGDLALLSQAAANDKSLGDTLQGVSRAHPKPQLPKLLPES